MRLIVRGRPEEVAVLREAMEDAEPAARSQGIVTDALAVIGSVGITTLAAAMLRASATATLELDGQVAPPVLDAVPGTAPATQIKIVLPDGTTVQIMPAGDEAGTPTGGAADGHSVRAKIVASVLEHVADAVE